MSLLSIAKEQVQKASLRSITLNQSYPSAYKGTAKSLPPTPEIITVPSVVTPSCHRKILDRAAPESTRKVILSPWGPTLKFTNGSPCSPTGLHGVPGTVAIPGILLYPYLCSGLYFPTPGAPPNIQEPTHAGFGEVLARSGFVSSAVTPEPAAVMDPVKSCLESVTKKKSLMEEMEQQQKRRISRVREETCSVHTQITSQFNEMHQLLTVKERRLHQNLREEEERILKPMEKNLREIEKNLNSIKEEMSKLQEQMDEKDSVIFLKEEVCRKRRMSDDNESLSVTDGALEIEKFDHSSLLNVVLKETCDAINRVSVTLDVDTANPKLEVSEDRKRVRLTETRRDLPDTGKRFTYWLCVLGLEEFTSGRHYWEVEVSGNRRWCLGIATESVGRKGWTDLTPETGVWSIGRVDDGFYMNTSPRSDLPAGAIPGTVGIDLSYESGTVSFYCADTKSHLHTFTGNKFTGKLYPFFRTWDVNKWLRICPGPVLHL
ncbi:E3 ubiquitin-protein ligase TRIM39-like [Narcine bancroftii]|uniref:E3 ubiquitin-protein ligase TRIM39-like n=1 Tax=Narcine bancroftii TaxID=1343680 RepID=UPI0038311F9F